MVKKWKRQSAPIKFSSTISGNSVLHVEQICLLRKSVLPEARHDCWLNIRARRGRAVRQFFSIDCYLQCLPLITVATWRQFWRLAVVSFLKFAIRLELIAWRSAINLSTQLTVVKLDKLLHFQHSNTSVSLQLLYFLCSPWIRSDHKCVDMELYEYKLSFFKLQS